LVCPPKNGGFAYGNNYGVRLARDTHTPDYIHLLNPDTMLRKGAIASLVQFLEAHEKSALPEQLENLDGSDWTVCVSLSTVLSEIEEGLQFGLTSRILTPWVVARTSGKSRARRFGPWRIDDDPAFCFWMAVGGLDDHYFSISRKPTFFRANQHGFQTWYVPEPRDAHCWSKHEG